MSTLLILASSDPDAELRCLRVDAGGVILGRLDADRTRPLPASFLDGVARSVLAVPGTDVRTLWLDLPEQNPLQALASAHQLLESHASGPLDAQHVALDVHREGQLRLVGVVARQAMHDWLQRCAAIGVVPDVMVPDHLLLPAPTGPDEVNVVADGDRWLARSAILAFSAEAALARQVLEPRELFVEADATGLERVLAQGAAAESAALNLMQYEFAPAATPREIPTGRRLGMLALVVLLSPAVLVAAQSLRYELAASKLDRQTREIAASIGPANVAGAGMVASPAAQARARNALFEAISRSPGLRLQALRYSAGAALEADLVHATADQLQPFGDALLQSGFVVEAGGSVGEGSELRTSIRLEPQT
jgi:general secretion pathway protein L